VILADHVHDGIAIYGSEQQPAYWNAGATAITGWQRSSDEAVALRSRPAGLAEIRPGKWVEIRRVTLIWEGQPAEAIIFNDVTAERRLAEVHQQFRDVGLMDPLTGLIGHQLLLDHARRAIALAERDGRPAGVIWMDLDRFVGTGSAPNPVADAVMRQCSRKVEQSIRASDVAARPEPESLAVMLTALRSAADLQIIAVRLLLTLSVPSLVEGRERSVSVTIGGAVFPGDGATAEDLVNAARRAASHGVLTGAPFVLASSL